MHGEAVKTTCPYCGVGCGVIVSPKPDGSADVKGDPEHPANFGRLCSKGSALGETLALDDRLLFPSIDGVRANWDDALSLVARRFNETIAEHGPDSVALYVSGQILTEDYYAANKLVKGYIGSANIDTNSRLCMASSVAGHKRAFGSDTVPGCYEDLELADLVVLVGSNLAWCHPVLYQRLAAAKETRGTKVVVIDPRRTATTELADMHLAIEPGCDVALFNGLFVSLVGANATSRDYVQRHTTGFKAAFDAAAKQSTADIAKTTGLTRLAVHDFYELFAANERVVTVYSQGVNQSIAGTDKVNAILNCHLVTGRIGKPGMGPFSVTGQPNAMGGREVGGLANMLAAHMELADPAHRRIVQQFWRSPRIADKAGLKAVDMFRAVGDGRIKAIWIMATNPVDSMPEADLVRAALKSCPFVVVSDVTEATDTAALAHVLLPAAAWGEKDGTVTNSERRISRQRPFMSAPGEARADWWQLAEVGRRMGFADAFAWSTPAEVFDEYAQLTATENDGSRDLDLGGVSALTQSGYDGLEPFQWPRAKGAATPSTRFFANGNFFTPDRKARFVATPVRAPALATSREAPFVLNTGRIRDQWHTMTRTAKTARLLSHIAEPFLEIHPADAAKLLIAEASLAEVESRFGRAILRAVVTERQRQGSVFAPMHWTDQVASAGRVDALIAGNVDPVSGQPELKAMPVAVRPFAAAWYGFAVSRDEPTSLAAQYWSKARAKDGWRVELAGTELPSDWTTWARDTLRIDASAELLAYHDAASGQNRIAAFDGDRLVAALYVADAPVAVSRSWAAAKLSDRFDDPRKRMQLLAGRAGAAEKDKGAIVCACFEVGQNEIADAVASGPCKNVGDVGVALKAGTNCGSCRAEIGRIIHAIDLSRNAAAVAG